MRAVAVAAALAACFAGPATAADYVWPVVRVIDGGTVEVDVRPDLPPELARLKIRLRGVDTPEKSRRAKRQPERVDAALDGGVAICDAIRPAGRAWIEWEL